MAGLIAVFFYKRREGNYKNTCQQYCCRADFGTYNLNVVVNPYGNKKKRGRWNLWGCVGNKKHASEFWCTVSPLKKIQRTITAPKKPRSIQMPVSLLKQATRRGLQQIQRPSLHPVRSQTSPQGQCWLQPYHFGFWSSIGMKSNEEVGHRFVYFLISSWFVFLCILFAGHNLNVILETFMLILVRKEFIG